MNLADLPTSNVNIIINLMLASITTSLIAHPLSRDVLSNATEEIKQAVSIQRAGLVFVHIASALMNYLISGAKRAKKLLEDKLLLYIKECVDPNFRHRPTSMQRIGKLV